MADNNRSSTRMRIMESAARLFAEKGFDGTGIEEIATTTGITKSVIYYHFKNKDELLESLVQSFIEESMDAKRTQAAKFFLQPDEQNIDSLLDFMISFCLEKKDLIRIFMMESIKRGPGSPLFKFWDANIAVGTKLYGEITQTKKRYEEEDFINMYFLAYIPIFSFFTYIDDWCAHYSVEQRKTVDAFKSVILRFFSEYMIPSIAPELDKK